MFDVTVIGSANLDLVVRTERHPGPGETVLGTGYAEYAGGKGLNQAVAAARAGATTAFVGALGADEAGHRLRAVAVADGIDLGDVVEVDDAPSGRALITVDRHGENSIVVVPGANATVGAPGRLRTRVLLGQLEVPLAAVTEAFAAAHADGVTTILNPAPAMPLGRELLAACQFVIPNEHEAALLGGVTALLQAGVGTVVVTLGAQGADLCGSDGSVRRIPAPKVEVVDTTGAGDTFCGALAARLAAGTGVEDAVTWAVAASALAVTRAGAIPSIPDAAATRRML